MIVSLRGLSDEDFGGELLAGSLREPERKVMSFCKTPDPVAILLSNGLSEH